MCLPLREEAGTPGLGKSQKTGRQGRGLKPSILFLCPIWNPERLGGGFLVQNPHPGLEKLMGPILGEWSQTEVLIRGSQEIEFSRASPDRQSQRARLVT